MISIVIPTYLQPNTGGNMLIVLLNSIMKQKTTVPYEVCVSDNDDNGGRIEEICDNFKRYIPLRRQWNGIKGASENFNNAIDMANYDKIKLMCMDDGFYSVRAIDNFSEAMDRRGWVISNSVHIDETGRVYSQRYTRYHHNQMETNVTGMPSVIGFRKCDIRFDTKLKTFCDTFFYYQLYEKYGEPEVLRSFNIACRFWRGSLSHNQPSNKAADLKYLRENKLIKC